MTVPGSSASTDGPDDQPGGPPSSSRRGRSAIPPIPRSRTPIMSTPRLSPSSPSRRYRTRTPGPISPAAGLALLLILVAAAPPPDSSGPSPTGATVAGRETPSPEQSLAPGDQGPAVEDLQR